jgi:hypothetical protein
MAKRSGSRAGGGLHSKNVVQKPVKVGQRAEAINERGVSQVGQAMGNKSTDQTKRLSPIENLRGAQRPAGSPGGVDLGNKVAASTVCGVGGSRDVQRSGSQGQHGPVAPGQPRPKGPDIWSEFPGGGRGR